MHGKWWVGKRVSETQPTHSHTRKRAGRQRGTSKADGSIKKAALLFGCAREGWVLGFRLAVCHVSAQTRALALALAGIAGRWRGSAASKQALMHTC